MRYQEKNEWFEGIIATYDGLKGKLIYFPSDGNTHFASINDEDLEILEWVLISSQLYDSSINLLLLSLLLCDPSIKIITINAINNNDLFVIQLAGVKTFLFNTNFIPGKVLSEVKVHR